MSLFLFQPHITGPEGAVTTPDVIVDHVFLDGAPKPVGLISANPWQQVNPAETAQAGFAITALGGGAILSPVVVLGSGMIIVSRQAWRLNNLHDHIGEVTLNGQPLSDVGLPDVLVCDAGGTDDALPRGYMVIGLVTGNSVTSELADPILARSLSHRVVFEPLDQDRWGADRPKPRYSVGPTQKDVTHYI